MKKRILSALLALCMVLALLPAEALAAEVQGLAGEQQDTALKVDDLSPGIDNPEESEKDEETPIGDESDIMPYANTTNTASYTLENGAVLTFDSSTGTIISCTRNGAMEIIIPEKLGGVSVTAIGPRTFRGTALTSITIPDSVTSIGAYAFYESSGLTSIELPDGVKSIGSHAFCYCSSLTSITIPGSVSFMDVYAFSHCFNLTNITIRDGVTSIGKCAFSSSLALTSITIPDSVKSIGSSAFSYCHKLTSITIPDSVTSIGNYAFQNCSGLTSIIIPDSVTSIGYDVFGGVPEDFTIYCYPGSYAETYAINNNINYAYLVRRSLSVSILTPEDTPVTESFTVTWYDETGSEVGSGLTLLGAIAYKAYAFDVRLGEDLASLYEQPERQTITPKDGAVRVVRLVPKEVIPTQTLALTGRVLDKSGRPVAGAEISIRLESGKTVDTVSGTDGSFTATLPYETVWITLQKGGYYKKTLVLDLHSETAGSFRMDDCILTEVVTISDRLTLNITQRLAVEDAGQAVEIPVTSLKAFTFVLTGSGGHSITDFETQGTALLFHSGAVSANETIHVRVEDPAGAYVGASADVKLDNNRLGSVELTMTQKGSFRLGSVSGPEARLLVFDDSGKCIQSGTAQGGMSGGVMDAGQYRLVFLQKSALLPSVPNFGYLQTLGLTAGRDYLLRDITIVDGKISPVDGCVVPVLNENAFSYMVPENTSVTTSKLNVSAGEQVLVRASYELDPAKAVSDTGLHIVLPDGVSVLENSSAYVNGSQIPYTYDLAQHEVRISVSGQGNATVYFYCSAVETGSHSVSAFLTLSNGAVQPVGSAVIQVENAKLNVTERTGVAEGIAASGKTLPNSTVILYDNDEEVGRTKSNAVGSWSIKFNLVQPVYSYSYHFIRAVTESAGLSGTIRISTEEAMITYSKDSAGQVTKITMYNTGDHGPQTTVFDFTDNSSTARPYYRMLPSRYPTFTFKVEFSGDASKLSEVYVVTTNSAGEKTYVETTYDSVSGAWVGTHDYTSFYDAPVEVGAAYNFEHISIGVDAKMIEDLEELFISEQKVLFEQVSEALSDSFTFSDVNLDGDVIKATLTVTDQDTREELFSVQLQAEASFINGTITAEDLVRQGYTLYDEETNVWCREEVNVIPGGQGGMPAEICKERTYICPSDDLEADGGVKLEVSERIAPTPAFKYGTVEDIPDVISALSDVADMAGDVLDVVKRIFELEIKGTSEAWGTWAYKISDIIPAAEKAIDKIDKLGKLFDAVSAFSTIYKAAEYNKKWNNILNGNIKTWNGILCVAKKTLKQPPEYCAIPDSATKRLENDLRDLDSAIENYKVNASKEIGNKARGKLTRAATWGALGMAASRALAGSGWGIVLSLEVSAWNSYFDKRGTAQDDAAAISAILKGQDEIVDRIVSISDELNKYCSKNPFSGLTNTSQGSVTPIADPSGYVYEAVPSNRLEGVKAVISSEAGGVWNAADYDQVNPQITGPDGSYYWDVPQGNWKVSFTKDGYEPADTSKVAMAVNGWLPVPPPQLEINVGMISTASPTVKQAVAYTDLVEVEFSQYMDIGSVKAALSLTANGTPLTDVTIEALDAEYNLEGTTQYATRFAIVYKGDYSGGLVVSVAGSAKNYAGKSLGTSYQSSALTASKRPTGIDAPETISIGLHQTVNVSFNLLPGVAGQTLNVESLTKDLVKIITASVTTNASGEASIKLEGLLPGSGLIQIIDPVSGVSTTIRVNISLEAGIEPVTASLKDGTAVTTGMTLPTGTAIYLSTTTEGAVIRYTLDDTCPCKEAALQYSGPIVLAKDTVLRATAWKDGVYSATTRLELHVNAANPGGGNPGGGSSSSGTSYQITVPTTENGTVTITPKSAKSGEKVTIIAKPDDGYTIGSVTITDSSGKSVIVTDNGDGTYTFIMPASQVTVRVTFTAIETSWTNPFTDVSADAYYYDAVQWAVKNGITYGTDATHFSPANGCTRAQFVTFLWRAADSPEPASAENPFTDVSETKHADYYKAILWAAEQGITVGTGHGNFSPDVVATRAQSVTFMCRYAQKAGIATETGIANFDDVSNEGALTAYYEAIGWAVANGITYGTGNGKFSPMEDCNRGMMITFLYRLFTDAVV